VIHTYHSFRILGLVQTLELVIGAAKVAVNARKSETNTKRVDLVAMLRFTQKYKADAGS
jgi:hypothetical protein